MSQSVFDLVTEITGDLVFSGFNALRYGDIVFKGNGTSFDREFIPLIEDFVVFKIEVSVIGFAAYFGCCETFRQELLKLSVAS